MIEQWLRQDIERGFANNATRIVITDAKSEGAFMRQYIPSEYPVIEADGDHSAASRSLEKLPRIPLTKVAVSGSSYFWVSRTASLTATFIGTSST